MSSALDEDGLPIVGRYHGVLCIFRRWLGPRRICSHGPFDMENEGQESEQLPEEEIHIVQGYPCGVLIE